MATITLDEARQNLTLWKEASAKLAKGQAVAFSGAGGGSRSVTRSNATEVREMIKYWSGIVAELEAQAAGGTRRGYSVANFRNPVR